MDIVFEGSPPDAIFVEIEIGGRGIKVGEWVERPDGFHVIRFTPEALDAAADLTRAANNLKRKQT